MADAVVTGGAGFIGSHLVERLLVDGHRVRVIDDLSTGRIENLSSCQGHPAFSLHRADISQGKGLAGLFAEADWVFHLAGLADIVPSIARPLDYHRVNVDGTVEVLEAARAAGAKRFLYAASSSCYGIPDSYPTPETAPARPMYPYALTKYIAEQYVLHWGKVYGLSCVSLRLFNVYGPRVRTRGTYGAVFGVFLAQKLNRRPLTVVGDGQQTRDFTYVTDVAEAFLRAARSDISGEALNVGSGASHSILELAGLLGGEIRHLPRRPGEPERTFADTSKIRRLLDWRPLVSFQEGVGRMLERIEEWRDAPVWDEASIEKATQEWFACLGGDDGQR